MRVHSLSWDIAVFVKRLPKNLRSNRWWIVWNKRLYLSTPHKGLATNPANQRNHVEEWVAESHHYVVWFLRAFPWKEFEGAQHALFLAELGMFGNMTKRLAAALATADSLGFGHVVVPRSAEFHGGIYERGVHDRGDRALFWMCDTRHSPHSPVTVLHKTDFLSGRALPTTELAAFSPSGWADLFSVLVSKPVNPALPDSHLVIHLRGGDVFGPRKPSSYGQPPLAFYQRILDNERWSAVTIVHQDDKNPVLRPFLETCKARKVPVTTHSGTVGEDVAELLRASTLVAGRGTFMPAVVGLSRNVKRVFYFHDKFSINPPIPGVETIRISDVEGTYVRDVLSNNWDNSDYQRNLMLTYPQSNLELGTLD
jgi:hypothetical protein